MTSRSAVAVVEDRRYRDHRVPTGHPESPDRLAAVADAVAARESEIERLASREAAPEEILRVHGRAHYERVEEAAKRAPLHLDPDTPISPESFLVARRAAGGAIDLARHVAAGRARAGLAAVRPPGHHAESDRAMGFCLFNNVAITARALQAEDAVGRILILDWDVHHGNGTQHRFEDDASVLFASTHQFPFYPGTGAVEEAGRGAGRGATVNIPLPAGCGDAEYTGAFQRVLAPVARAFRPELILVSCGFDAHRDDPLAGMELSGEGFARMAAIVRALADDLCDGRVVFILEGGYSPLGLREGTQAVLSTLLAPTAPAVPAEVPLSPGTPLEAVVGRLAQVHGGRFPGLGSA